MQLHVNGLYHKGVPITIMVSLNFSLSNDHVFHNVHIFRHSSPADKAVNDLSPSLSNLPNFYYSCAPFFPSVKQKIKLFLSFVLPHLTSSHQ